MDTPHPLHIKGSFRDSKAEHIVERTIWLPIDPAEVLDAMKVRTSFHPLAGSARFSRNELKLMGASHLGEEDVNHALDLISAKMIFMASTGLRPEDEPRAPDISGTHIGRTWIHVGSKEIFRTLENTNQSVTPPIITSAKLAFGGASLDGIGDFIVLTRNSDDGVQDARVLMSAHQDAIKMNSFVSKAVAMSSVKQIRTNRVSSERRAAAPDKVRSESMATKKAQSPAAKKPHDYPRGGKFALGNPDLFEPNLEKLIKQNERDRKRGIPVNFGAELASLLEDAFQCGVVTQDVRLGTATEIPQSRDRTLMHKQRVSKILFWAKTSGKARDDDTVRDLMHKSMHRAFQDGARFARTGALDLSPLLTLEATRLWREVPSRFEEAMMHICSMHEIAVNEGKHLRMDLQDYGDLSLEVFSPDSPKDVFRTEPPYLRSVTPAAIRSLETAGFVVTNGATLVATDKAVAAFKEYRPYYNKTLEELRAQRDAEMRLYFGAPKPEPVMDGEQKCAVLHPFSMEKRWVTFPCNPEKHFRFERYFTCCGHLLHHNGNLYVDRSARGIPEDVAILGATIIANLLETDGIDVAPYDRERRWTPKSSGFGSDAFYDRRSGAEIHLQKVSPKTREATIPGWEAEHALRFVEIFRLNSGMRYFLFSDDRHAAVVEDLAVRLRERIAPRMNRGVDRDSEPEY